VTATHVNGVAVRTDHDTLSPIKTKDGKAVWWKQTRTLTLENGNVWYGCSHCDYVSQNINGVRPHLGAHSSKPRKPRATSTGNDTLDGLVNRLRQAEHLEKDRDHWKARAVAAEGTVRRWTAALKEMGLNLEDTP